MNDALRGAADWLRERVPFPPAVGVILGSGLGAFAEAVEEQVSIPYGEIPGFPASKVVGHAGRLVAGRVRGVPTVVLAGRVHFYEGHPMERVVFPARVLGLLGCRDVIVTNAAGAINRRLRAGDLMLMTDHVNAFGTNPLIGPNDDELGPRFPDMSDAYRRELRALANRVARKERIPLKGGVYLGTHGPSYETPAEIRAFRALGADAVGMSSVPEAIALVQMGIGVIGISCITNMAAGVLQTALVHSEVLETTRRVGERFVRLLTALVGALGADRSGEDLPDAAPRKPKKAAPAPRRRSR